MTSKTALVLVSIKMISGQEILKRLVNELKLISWDLEFSSVYVQYETEQRYDFDANMVTVLKIVMSQSTQELAQSLERIQNYLLSYTGPNRVKLVPLAIEQETLLIPGLTLPHPSLHGDALVIRCAAEVWGHYEHPVLKKTLHDLARHLPPITNAEFMLQGKSLVER
jgi:7,8-dihydro-6-hydroxymethylpterin-pyrophosphokinase